jgi:hypothetical protein
MLHHYFIYLFILWHADVKLHKKFASKEYFVADSLEIWPELITPEKRVHQI